MQFCWLYRKHLAKMYQCNPTISIRLVEIQNAATNTTVRNDNLGVHPQEVTGTHETTEVRKTSGEHGDTKKPAGSQLTDNTSTVQTVSPEKKRHYANQPYSLYG